MSNNLYFKKYQSFTFYVSYLLLIHSTLLPTTSGHQMYGNCFSHTKQFCDTRWVSCNLTQFWLFLPGKSIWSHRCPTSDDNHIVGPKFTPKFCPTWLQIRESHNLFLLFLLKQLMELRKTLIYVYQFIKVYNKGYR